MLAKRILLSFSFFVLLILTPFFSARAEAAPAEEITGKCTLLLNGEAPSEELRDARTDTHQALEPGSELILESSKTIGGLYVKFSVSAPWTLRTAEGEERSCGENGFLHEFIGELNTKSLSLLFPEGCDLAQLKVYSPGEPPESVQRWEPCWERADVLFLPTHSDDEQLYFAGLIPWCLSRGARVQVVYLISHRDAEVRIHEALDGLWASGLRNYPVLGEFADLGNLSYEQTLGIYINRLQNWETFEGRLVGLYRRFQPQVVVTHAQFGESGHGAHILNYMTSVAAAKLSNDASRYTESAEKYGTWEVPKLYVHSCRTNPVVLNFDQPLSLYGGRTAFQTAQDAFEFYPSQHGWGYWDWLNSKPQASRLLPRPDQYGLYISHVGDDEHTDTLFDHVVLYDEQDAVLRAEEEARLAVEHELEAAAELRREREEAKLREAAEREAQQAADEAAERERQDKLAQMRIIIIRVSAIVMLLGAGAVALLMYNRKKSIDQEEDD